MVPLVPFVMCLGSGLWALILAARAGRSAVGWCLLGLLFPILAVLVLAELPRVERPRRTPRGARRRAARKETL